MKKKLSAVMTACMLTFALAACGNPGCILAFPTGGEICR